MDAVIPCPSCGQLRRKSNMSRHIKSCRPSVSASVLEPGELDGDSGRGRSVSREPSIARAGYGCRDEAGVVPGYSPTSMPTLLSAAIQEAVPALLDQHGTYSQPHLEQYLEKFFPEIPEACRSSVVLAATLGARQAALLHMVWEKNVNSADPNKREFAAGAASSLSFWALGLRPIHRSGDVFSSDAQQQQQQSAVATSSVASATDVVKSSDVASLLDSVQLPVSMAVEDVEFRRLLGEVVAQSAGVDVFSQPVILSPMSSLSAVSVVASEPPLAFGASAPASTAAESSTVPAVPVHSVSMGISSTSTATVSVSSPVMSTGAAVTAKKDLVAGSPFVIAVDEEGDLDADISESPCPPVSFIATGVQPARGSAGRVAEVEKGQRSSRIPPPNASARSSWRSSPEVSWSRKRPYEDTRRARSPEHRRPLNRRQPVTVSASQYELFQEFLRRRSPDRRRR